MPMEDVVRALGLAGVPTAALRAWSADYLAGVTRRHRAVVEDSGGTLIPVSVVTDVDLVDSDIEITMAPATAGALATAVAAQAGDQTAAQLLGHARVSVTGRHYIKPGVTVRDGASALTQFLGENNAE